MIVEVFSASVDELILSLDVMNGNRVVFDHLFNKEVTQRDVVAQGNQMRLPATLSADVLSLKRGTLSNHP